MLLLLMWESLISPLMSSSCKPFKVCECIDYVVYSTVGDKERHDSYFFIKKKKGYKEEAQQPREISFKRDARLRHDKQMPLIANPVPDPLSTYISSPCLNITHIRSFIFSHHPGVYRLRNRR